MWKYHRKGRLPYTVGRCYFDGVAHRPRVKGESRLADGAQNVETANYLLDVNRQRTHHLGVLLRYTPE